ncbi:MAG: Ig-like domain-containing protein [Clostridiales bacterium]|nr:Ig-like domain-containing protein [Clostridiales bacterium]
MKLIRSQKKDADKNQALEQYPKVKTFSKAYDYAPKKNDTPAVPSGNSPFFAPDERPYPTAVPSASLPEIPSKTADFNDPERIDLQDTLLTDESFVERPLKQSEEVSGGFTADAPDERCEPEAVSAADDEYEEAREAEPEEDSSSDNDDFWKTEEPDTAGISEEREESRPAGLYFPSEPDEEDTGGSFYEPEPEDSTESLFTPDPDAGYEAGSFFEPDEDTDVGPAMFPESGPVADSGSEAPEEPGQDSSDPFSWFESDADSGAGKSSGFKFKKKKYTVVIGKKKNLKKKLVSRPAGSLKWKSSDKKIAKVSRKGVLKPKKKGKVIVRVKAKGGKRAKVKIRVTSAKKPKMMSWEKIGTEKKPAADKKWARFA